MVPKNNNVRVNLQTHAGSQPSESLSVKESQTIYKTITPTAQSTDNNYTEKPQISSWVTLLSHHINTF